MTDTTDNLVLEHLRHIRQAVDGLREDNREIKSRLGILERQYALLGDQYASLSSRLDRIETRLDRIENRLQLADA